MDGADRPLGERMARVETRLDGLKEDVTELRQNVDAAGVRLTALERFQQWVTLAVGMTSAALGALSVLFVDPIKEWFNRP